jgi:hypothetical protein
MSLATLKRKTNNGNPRNAPGTLRVPSMGKTTNLGRRQARTPFRGTEPMGHGGGWRGRLNLPTSKVGTYERNLHFSGLCCTKNDDEIVKTSVKNTKGMIETRYSGTLHSAYKVEHYIVLITKIELHMMKMEIQLFLLLIGFNQLIMVINNIIHKANI